MKLHTIAILVVFTVLACSADPSEGYICSDRSMQPDITRASMGDAVYAHTATYVENASVYEWLSLIGIQYPVVDTDSSDSSINENVVVQNTGFNESEDSKLLPYVLPQTQIGIRSYSYESDFLKIRVGEQYSGSTYNLDWTYLYDPVGHPDQFIHSIYREQYAVATDNWSDVKWSTSFTIDTYFGSEEAPDTAMLHYDNLSLTRQVNPPVGSAKSFSITYVLTNTGDSTLENVRFFQGIDYDIGGSGNDYAWYIEATDTVWQNDDDYFKNGFHGSHTSSHHDCNYYTSMWSDIHSGNLNDLTKYPESGMADCGIALQWDAGDLAPQASWDLTITFYFGEAAGIEANAGPDQTAGRGQPVTFDASGSSSVGNITTYEWDFDDDDVYDVSVDTPIYVYEAGWAELGEYIVGLRVTDDEGRNDTDTAKITVVPNVDLIITNVTFTPTEINDGDIVIFNATVENIGTEDLADDFYVRFEIDDGSYIGRQRVSGGIPAGDSVHVLQNWEADAGTRNVSVCADRGYYSSENNLIPEADETNNKLSQALPAILFPDLIITSLLCSPTEGINDGDTVTFTTTVENVGVGNTASDFYVGFEIDGNYIGSQRVSGLSTGSSTEVSHIWDADAGIHTVKAVVDYYNEITESNETNNELSQALPEIPFPDLTVTDISWSPQTDIGHGDTVTFTATVENIGVGNTSSNFYVKFEIDENYIGHRKVSGGLAAGDSTAVNLDWIAFEGNHIVKAIVDEYDAITESNETNNEKSEVLPPIPQPPQVNVTSPNGYEVWHGARDITWDATSPEGLDLTIKIELYNGHSYKLIADSLPDTGIYQNWDTAKFADGSPVPDSTYYKIRITATDTGGVSGSDLSDNWFTIWNTPIVEILSVPYSQTTTESVNATYYLTVVNKQPFADTFDLLVDNTDSAAVAELSQSTVEINPLESATMTLNVTDETSGTYRVIVKAVSQTNASITGEITITTYVRDAFTVGVSAPRTETSIGGVLTYEVELANDQEIADDFTIDVTGIDENWFSMVDSCHLTAGETEVIPLEISIPDTASVGEFPLTIQATSSNLGTTKEISATLNVSTDPVIFDLTPADNTPTGATEVLFTWTSSVDSTTELFIKAQGEADYTLVSGDAGIYHAVSAANLTRDAWYDFYVRCNSTHGSASSEVRSIFIDNGIAFSQRNYEFTIERDYNQERIITVINTDDEPHEVMLDVSGVPEDLALSFVGEGSMDQVVPLHPGESKDIAIVFHAQDAQAEGYTLLLNLTNLGAEEITDFAQLKLHIHFPVVDFIIEEIGSDPYTLAKTLRVTNNGDPLTDLGISASDELSSILMFQPSINHAYLGSGRSIEFDAIPVLSEGFTGVSGTIVASATGEERNLSINFTVPEGKQIFTGSWPRVNIELLEAFDNDDIPNTNPTSDAVVDSFEVDGIKAFNIYVGVQVYQEGEPASDIDVRVTIWNSQEEVVLEEVTDILGTVIVGFHGPIGIYSYKAEAIGYGATETRSFTVNDTPKFSVHPMGIHWASVSDADSTFDLTQGIPDSIELDNSPFTFTATVEDSIPEGAVAILQLRPIFPDDVDETVSTLMRNSFLVEIGGQIEGNNLNFSTELVPLGDFEATIMLLHPSEVNVPIMPMAFSPQLTLEFTDEYVNKPLDYGWQRLFSIDPTHYGILTIEQETTVANPEKVIVLDHVDPRDGENVYVFSITATRTMDDSLIIEVKDTNGVVIYSDIRPIHLEANVTQDIEVPVPWYDAENNPIGEFEISVTTANLAATTIFIIWVGAGALVSIVDRYVEEAGAVKCAIFFINPGAILGAGVVDLSCGIYKESGWGVLKGVGRGSLGAGCPMKTAGKATNYIVLKAGRSAECAAKWGKWVKTGVGKGLTGFHCGMELYEIYKKYWGKIKDGGAVKTANVAGRDCINHAPVEVKFPFPDPGEPGYGRPGGSISSYRDVPEDSVEGFYGDADTEIVPNIEGVFVTAYFPREVPDYYEPFDTVIMLNGHEIGRITDAVPQGHYTFEADPTFLNYADTGFAENTITLDVEGMNRGYYVPLEGYKIDISLKKLTRAICAASQAEADQIIANLSTAVAHKADFAVCPADMSFSNPQPSEGENVTIEATIHNLGSRVEIGADVQFLDNEVEIATVTAPCLLAFSTETVSTNWTATGGTHNIQVRVNPDQEINESDYTNNEATKTISITAPDTTPPVMSNPQPPDGSTVADSMPLISLDLADPDSGINTTAVRIAVDDSDVTQNATVISSRVWYTPEYALADGGHNVSVYAEDNKGNNNSLQWSFTVATEKQPPVASFTYSPSNPVINENITFNASNSCDPDGFIVKYEWAFGDEMEATGEIVEHSYLKSRDYTVILRVTDNDGLSHTNIMIVTVSSAALPDLTLTSEDIQLILPSSDSTASSAGQRILDMTTSYTEKTAVKLLETTKNVRPSGDITHNQGSKNKVSISSFLPSFMIVNLTYPLTVDPNQTFQVTVHTNYSFENTTYVYVGIWDYDASEYIAGTPIPETTLSGSGNTSYTLNLTAPPSGIMDLSADLCYWDGEWNLSDYRNFDVKVGTQSFTVESLTYPPTVNPNQTFQVVVDTNYSFNATTDIFAGIWDYNTSEYIAGTPDNETLSGIIGNKTYTFNLTAPPSGIMHLSADLWYYDDYQEKGILSDYRDFDVNISAEEPDFTITATPSSQTVSQGDPASYTISLTSLNEFNSPVTLTVSGLPSGTTGLFNPNPVIPSNVSNLTINTLGTTPTGNHTLSITGVSGEITHQTTVTLNITGKENIATISATIHNIGTADVSNVIVQFFDGNPDAGGVRIGIDQTIPSIPAGDTGSAQVSWDITEKVGSHVIHIKIDPYNTIAESDEGNNQASKQIPFPGVTCSDPDVVIDDTKTSVTNDPVGDGYDVTNVPADVDLTDARGFDITATGADGTHLFDITFPSPVTENFVLYKLPAWTEIPYTTIGPYTIQVQLDITGGVLDPAFILASVEGIRGDLNHDGEITPADAVIALQIAAGSHPPDPATLAAADVSGDGRVTSLDALMIMQAAVGNIEL